MQQAYPYSNKSTDHIIISKQSKQMNSWDISHVFCITLYKHPEQYTAAMVKWLLSSHRALFCYT